MKFGSARKIESKSTLSAGELVPPKEASVADLVKDLPLVNFEPTYNGKIMVFKSHDRIIIRGGQDHHKQIREEFCRELERAGLKDFYSAGCYNRGGARVCQSEQLQRIHLYGASADYGPLKDQQEVLTTLESAFPGYNVKFILTDQEKASLTMDKARNS